MSAPPAINGKSLPIRLLIAMPPQTTSTPNAIVKSTWPAPATPVTARVFGFFQCCARAATTKGSQCVGMAACRNATAKPVATRVMKTKSFISDTISRFVRAEFPEDSFRELSKLRGKRRLGQGVRRQFRGTLEHAIKGRQNE